MAKHIHALEINTSRMIRITNLHEFFAFENAFVTTDPFYPTMRQKIVDWRAVADKYTGIEIAPSLCDVLGDVFRHHYWYSNWDCASGCIWDRTIVKSVKLVASYNAGAKSYIFAKNTA
jgi:hypothetical protein